MTLRPSSRLRRSDTTLILLPFRAKQTSILRQELGSDRATRGVLPFSSLERHRWCHRLASLELPARVCLAARDRPSCLHQHQLAPPRSEAGTFHSTLQPNHANHEEHGKDVGDEQCPKLVVPVVDHHSNNRYDEYHLSKRVWEDTCMSTKRLHR